MRSCLDPHNNRSFHYRIHHMLGHLHRSMSHMRRNHSLHSTLLQGTLHHNGHNLHHSTGRAQSQGSATGAVAFSLPLAMAVVFQPQLAIVSELEEAAVT